MGNFNLLPTDIISNILTRLPIESVLDCKLVSKTWNTIVSCKSFAQSHLNHCLENLDSTDGTSGKFTFLLLNEVDSRIDAHRQFHYLEYHVENSSSEEPFHRVIRMKLNPTPFVYYSILGSSNGLVCLNEWHTNEPVYICNPVTRECVFLPELKKTSGRGKRLLSGFGYVSSKNEYKVARMYNLLKEPNFVQFEVYTLGSGKGWRNIGKKLEIDLELFDSIHGELLNESLYYVLKDGKIVAFDLTNEIFVELPKPFSSSWDFSLGVFGDHLSATHHDRDSDGYDIFLLKKKKDGSLSWVKEFSLSQKGAFESLVLTCRGTVLCRSGRKVYIHDLNSQSSKVLVDFGDNKRICQAIPHMNTLVSLKALGEENTKTMEIVDVTREVVDELVSEHGKRMKQLEMQMLMVMARMSQEEGVVWNSF